jgi:hypothetical protein
MKRTFKVKKTSPQWRAHPQFLYCIEFDRISYQQAVEDFTTGLIWCWESLGPSIDLQSWKALSKSKDVNTTWCWENQTTVHANRIYLYSSKEVDAFLLKWN